MTASKNSSEQTKNKTASTEESVYKKQEVLENASAFSVSRELLAGALRLSDKEKFTRKEVENLIQKFKKRGV